MRTFLEWVDHPDLDNESHYSAKLKHFNNNIEFPKLSIADREFLHTYTNDSSEVNSNLWTIKKKIHKLRSNDSELFSQHDKDLSYTHRLNGILNSFEPSNELLTVYSGIKSSPEGHLIHGAGMIHVPSLISASLDPQVAGEFALKNSPNNHAHVLRIHVKPNQNVGGFIKPFSRHKGEEEYLLKPNQLLMLHANPSIHHATIDNQDMIIHVWDAHIPSVKESLQHLEKHPVDIPQYKSHITMRRLLDNYVGTHNTTIKDKIRW
jgi:hypothetical protein